MKNKPGRPSVDVKKPHINITIEPEHLEFLNSEEVANKSAYIRDLLNNKNNGTSKITVLNTQIREQQGIIMNLQDNLKNYNLIVKMIEKDALKAFGSKMTEEEKTLWGSL